ncbi:hypothetical protein F4775DRAFT_412770 [Biscogniauxia sp. FL1348]|nr:hypothetical protein F4775DRAFT_412770 [Biscogniauxia sp. FL1348]
MEADSPVHLTYDIPPNGLTVIVRPAEPTLDVVFIHGFTGHPERTWTHKHGFLTRQGQDIEEPPTKIRKINLFSKDPKNRSTSRSSVYWPRDLLPDTLPTARVLTYGYDTRIKHAFGSSPNTNTVYDIGWDLLVALEGERRESSDRPIIFIVHSLGGIVVKEMLRRSDGCKSGQVHLRSICNSTRAVLFFGTPHGGADPRGPLLKALERVVKSVGFSVNQQVVDTLLPSSERLRELRDHFAPMVREYGWLVHSFQESVGLKALNGDKVVSDTSSCLSCPDIEVTEHIALNHMDMCRFSDATDVEYRKVVNAITRIRDGISNTTASRDISQVKGAIGPEDCAELLNSLRFDQIDSRHATIKRAHAKTCRWFLAQPEYVSWLDPARYNEHNGLLWIKGNPGTGKSTLMKYLLSQAQNPKMSLTLSFFFNARGEDLERSTCGLYRSLLLQLLESDPALQPECCRRIRPHIYSKNDWEIEVLKELLDTAITSHSGSIRLFVDALDECDETEVREMLSFFNQLGETASGSNLELFICFSSRHYPHITIEKGIQLVLEREEGHSHDIASYLSSELRIGRSKLAETVREEVLQKASGIFMWVVLVVQILNKEYDHGQVHALRRKLQDIPGDLHRLFETILERDERNRGQLLACIQFVLFARRPLSREELYHAILASTDIEALTPIDNDYITPEVIDRFILSASKGLAEVTRSRKPRVQFIHESVRDYLLKHCSIPRLWSEYSAKFAEKSHEKMANHCLRYLEIDIRPSVFIPDVLTPASSDESKLLRETLKSKFPFLEYAARNIFYHADLAQAGGICQRKFLQSFPMSRWVTVDNVLAQYDTRRHKKPSLCYLLAELDAANLISVDDSYNPKNAVIKERYGEPILAAIAHDNIQAISALLQLNYPDGDKSILRTQPLHGTKASGTNMKLDPSTNKSILRHLISYGDVRFVDYVLSSKLKRDGILYYDDALFHDAVIQQKPDILRLFLKKYNFANIANGDFMALIIRIAVDQHILETLCDYNLSAVTEACAKDGLSLAIRRMDDNVVRVFLERCDFGTMESNGILHFDRWLTLALEKRQVNITRLLVSKITELYGCYSFFDKFDITRSVSLADEAHLDTLSLVLDAMELESCVGKDLLQALVRNPNLVSTEKGFQMIEKLVAKGMPVDERNEDTPTALHVVVDSVRITYAVMHLLLKNGADPNVGWCTRFKTLYPFSEAGDTILHIVVRRHDFLSALSICHHGASLDARNSAGYTPAELARQLGHHRICQLLEKGGDGNCAPTGRTYKGIPVTLSECPFCAHDRQQSETAA